MGSSFASAISRTSSGASSAIAATSGSTFCGGMGGRRGGAGRRQALGQARGVPQPMYRPQQAAPKANAPRERRSPAPRGGRWQLRQGRPQRQPSRQSPQTLPPCGPLRWWPGSRACRTTRAAAPCAPAPPRCCRRRQRQTRRRWRCRSPRSSPAQQTPRAGPRGRLAARSSTQAPPQRPRGRAQSRRHRRRLRTRGPAERHPECASRRRLQSRNGKAGGWTGVQSELVAGATAAGEVDTQGPLSTSTRKQLTHQSPPSRPPRAQRAAPP